MLVLGTGSLSQIQRAVGCNRSQPLPRDQWPHGVLNLRERTLLDLSYSFRETLNRFANTASVCGSVPQPPLGQDVALPFLQCHQCGRKQRQTDFHLFLLGKRLFRIGVFVLQAVLPLDLRTIAGPDVKAVVSTAGRCFMLVTSCSGTSSVRAMAVTCSGSNTWSSIACISPFNLRRLKNSFFCAVVVPIFTSDQLCSTYSLIAALIHHIA